MYSVTTKSLKDHVSKTWQLAMMPRPSSELHMHAHTFAHRHIRTYEIHCHTTCTHSYYYHLFDFTNNRAQEGTQDSVQKEEIPGEGSEGQPETSAGSSRRRSCPYTVVYKSVSVLTAVDKAGVALTTSSSLLSATDGQRRKKKEEADKQLQELGEMGSRKLIIKGSSILLQ